MEFGKLSEQVNAGESSPALVRKSDVIRLLNEYLNDKDAPAHTRTVLRAIRHDVRHDLPNKEVDSAD